MYLYIPQDTFKWLNFIVDSQNGNIDMY